MTEPRWTLLRTVFRRSARAEVNDEIAFHVEMRAQELIAQGMDPDRARGMAAERFGPRQPVERELIDSTRRRRTRASRAEVLMQIARDARHAVRMLSRTPGFTAIAVLTIALGIGATTAIYSVVDAVLLRPLPFPGEERLVVPRTQRIGTDERWNVTYHDFLAWQRDSVFEAVALLQWAELDITGDCAGVGCDPERLDIAFLTSDFFRVLAVKPLIGRLPQPDEFSPGAPRTMVISHALWQRRFGGDPAVINSQIRMTGFPVTVIGVLPAGAEWPRGVNAWYPYRQGPSESTLAPDNHIYMGIARLRAGRSLGETREQLAMMARQVAEEHPAKRSGTTVTAQPIHEIAVAPQMRRALWVLLGAVAVVLLIACVNVANLMLARATAREREFSVRTAIGAGRWRLARQLLTESLVLALAGGVLGVALAVGLARALVRLAPPDVLSPATVVHLSVPTLLTAAAVTVLSALLFGLAPAVRASNARPAQALAATSGRTAGGRRQRRASAALVVAEVAMSLTLLAGAGLLAKSLMKLRDVDTGLDIRETLAFRIALPQGRFEGNQQVAAFWDEFMRRLRGIPGVTAASVTTALPLGGGGVYLGRTMIEAGAPEPPGGPEVDIMWTEVGTQYFEAAGQPILAGRPFEERDDTTASPKIIVTRAFAQTMFPGQPLSHAVGRQVFSWRDERVRREIVGVAGDVRLEGATDAPRPIVYVPQRQSPRLSGAVLVRGRGGAGELARAARRELAALDPGIALANVQTMEDALARSIAPLRFNAILFGAFAMLALLLASIGLYGVLSYAVARDTREIGVRMALGASPSGIRARVLARSVGLTAIGAIIGLAGALAFTRILGSLLFEVQPADPGTFALMTAVLFGVAALAGWIPARRATRIDPSLAMRAE